MDCVERCRGWKKRVDSKYVHLTTTETVTDTGKGTGGVSMFALKLARAAGLKVILSSSSDEKLSKMKKQFPNPPPLTVNYATNPEWHEDVLEHAQGVGFDLVIEVGGTGSLVKSMKCTRRGGTISQVGYLDKQDPSQLEELLPLIFDKRLVLR